jgi:hypothetical protein
MALYETRLTQIGEQGTEDEEDIKARQWAACALGEACCVLELRFGKEAAEEMIQAMLASRASYNDNAGRKVEHHEDQRDKIPLAALKEQT